MVTKQILFSHDVATLEEFFELIFSIIDNGVEESRVLFNLLSVQQKTMFFRYIAENYYDDDTMCYPMRDLKSILIQDNESDY
jgi:hypothetical protein